MSDTYQYEAFGSSSGSSGNTSNLYGFAGEQFDVALGMYYLRQRLMDPGGGRFMTMDSYEGDRLRPDTLHDYQYAAADPINNIDPSGRVTLGELSAGIGSAVNLSLRAVSLYNIFSTTQDEGENFEKIVIPFILMVVGGGSGMASSPAFDPSIPPVIGPQKHHTVPEYLCRHANQTLVRLPFDDHVKIHGALYSIRVAALLGQKLVVEKLLRKPTKTDRNKDRFLLGGSSAGRAALAEAIQFVYEAGDWMGTGILPIGRVFPREKQRFIA